MLDTPAWIQDRLRKADYLHLFLDYDGTLAEFAPTPAQVDPDPTLVDLVRRLVQHPCLQVVVISGRSLDQLEALLPSTGCLLAGTYGIEWIRPEGERGRILDLLKVRPVLEELKTEWEAIVADRPDLYLEDKGWSLALHARTASEAAAEQVMAAARQAVARRVNLDGLDGLFRGHGGPRFYEVCPALAHKGSAVEQLFENGPWPGALPVYLGDDYNDEEAFEVIHTHGGITILVTEQNRPAQADLRLENPQAARQWLEELLGVLRKNPP